MNIVSVMVIVLGFILVKSIKNQLLAPANFTYVRETVGDSVVAINFCCKEARYF